MTFPHRIFRIYGQPALLAGAVIVASLLRLQTLGGSLGHDEAYTLQAFASQPYERIITSYPAPNNHILHSLLVRCSVQLLGTETWIARFPALVAGILAVPLIFVLGRSLFLNPHAGLIAAWLLAIMPAHISYSQVARGYSLSILLSVLSLFFAKKAVDEGKIRLWAAFGLCGFLGAWTLPSNAFLVVSLGIWAGLVASRNVRSKAIATTLASVLVIVLVYLPIRAELERAGGRWGIDVWEDPLALLGVFVGTAKIWIGGMEGIFPAVAALGGLLLTVYRRRDIRALLRVCLDGPPTCRRGDGDSWSATELPISAAHVRTVRSLWHNAGANDAPASHRPHISTGGVRMERNDHVEQT
jgi:hypothetical protein